MQGGVHHFLLMLFILIGSCSRLSLLLTSKKFKKMMPIPWGILSKVTVAFFAGNILCKILQQLFNKLVINNYFQAQTMTLFFETRYKIWVWFVVCHAYSGWCPSRYLSWGRGIVRHQIHKGREWIKSNMESVLGLWFKSSRYSSNGSLVPCDLWRNQQSSEEVKKEEGGSVLHRDINSKSIVQLHVTRNL